MLDHQEFDAAELSLASYTTLVAREASPFVAIPVMLSKLFRHSCIYVRRGAGIERPQDLKGKRVGTTQYGATAVVYLKGLLQDEYGVKPEDMQLVHRRPQHADGTAARSAQSAGNIALEFLPRGQTLEALFEEGKLDALFAILLPQLFLGGSPQIARLFPNHREVEEDYYRRTNILPIMHTVVIRKDVYRDHPFVAASLYRAFLAARDRALEPLLRHRRAEVSLPFLIDHIEQSRRIFGDDFWAYGVEPNRPALDALCRYVHEQGLAPRRTKPDDLFVPCSSSSAVVTSRDAPFRWRCAHKCH